MSRLVQRMPNALSLSLGETISHRSPGSVRLPPICCAHAAPCGLACQPPMKRHRPLGQVTSTRGAAVRRDPIPRVRVFHGLCPSKTDDKRAPHTKGETNRQPDQMNHLSGSPREPSEESLTWAYLMTQGFALRTNPQAKPDAKLHTRPKTNVGGRGLPSGRKAPSAGYLCDGSLGQHCGQNVAETEFPLFDWRCSTPVPEYRTDSIHGPNRLDTRHPARSIGSPIRFRARRTLSQRVRVVSSHRRQEPHSGLQDVPVYNDLRYTLPNSYAALLPLLMTSSLSLTTK
jgi:hypothetical protein